MKRHRIQIFAVMIAMACLLYHQYQTYTNRPLPEGRKVVVCIPTYGQSLALGEEAVRVTDFERLKDDYDGRILTENLDYRFGYFENNKVKKFFKKLFHYQKRAFELSVYRMAESLATQLGNDTLICIFAGGQGTTMLQDLSRGTEPYNRFLDNIKTAHEKATKLGWQFYVPAICWMQGESDIAEYPDTDYKQLLRQFCSDINRDVQAITHQTTPVCFISYQTNAVARASQFDAHSYDCREVAVPQALMELIRDDSLFWPSGPIYHYTYAREAIHIDGVSQNRLGQLAAKSALRIIRHQEHLYGLMPTQPTTEGNDIVLSFRVPCPPLRLDTVNVSKADNYGFNVVTKRGTDILVSVSVGDSIVRLTCSQPPSGCKLRYAVNGELGKSGCLHGPRGNLRDSQGDADSIAVAGQTFPKHNWCYQFEALVP